ncbi:HD domain-containing phosphohydrolase [Cellulosilyticum lentocellum]|uniref:Uncharacterized protein n=1 Tax=Cellulosilyticum lentocellum (strain ATCC 49066 / DSM 5427 / NCIMB 11756 / RHM5) TaxID=642492 RepID=F2JNV4_CELLD|nr:HD domain-containing phosphohydrolase [Cellulosilyticum lentocellum]ADZ82452.1 hypothetical protein Clole_0719 [Cellulosilyticum lentocellum DSM 5427]
MEKLNEVEKEKLKKRFESTTRMLEELPELEQRYVAGIIAGLYFRSTSKTEVKGA